MINYIDDQLAVGAVADIKDTDKRDALRKLGFSFIIDIRVLFTQPEANTLDDCVPDMTLMPDAVDSLIELSKKHKIVIHCHGGIDRAPFVAMQYIRNKHNLTYDEAYDIVSYARPQTIQHWEWIDILRHNLEEYNALHRTGVEKKKS